MTMLKFYGMTLVKYLVMLALSLLLGGAYISQHQASKPAPQDVLAESSLVLSPAVPIDVPLVAVVPVSAIIEKPAPRTRILFTGDITLGRCIAKRTLSSNSRVGNFNYPFELVADELRRADITVGSLDGSLSDKSVPIPCSRTMNLIGPTRMVEGLQFAGFDAITVATNHVKDCGEWGFECDNIAMFDTLDTLKNAGIQPMGAGKSLLEARQPAIVERNGIRFAFLGISQIEKRIWAGEKSPGTAPLSQEYIELIKSDIVAAKQIADVVIVMPHWGVEYAPVPDDIQRVWAEEFVNAGASLVVGNHPHITQPMDMFSGKPAFYALGNFVFDQEHSFRRESVVLEVTFLGGEIESWNLRAAEINYYTLQTYWVEDGQAGLILARANR